MTSAETLVQSDQACAACPARGHWVTPPIGEHAAHALCPSCWADAYAALSPAEQERVDAVRRERARAATAGVAGVRDIAEALGLTLDELANKLAEATSGEFERLRVPFLTVSFFKLQPGENEWRAWHRGPKGPRATKRRADRRRSDRRRRRRRAAAKRARRGRP